MSSMAVQSLTTWPSHETGGARRRAVRSGLAHAGTPLKALYAHMKERAPARAAARKGTR